MQLKQLLRENWWLFALLVLVVGMGFAAYTARREPAGLTPTESAVPTATATAIPEFADDALPVEDLSQADEDYGPAEPAMPTATSIPGPESEATLTPPPPTPTATPFQPPAGIEPGVPYRLAAPAINLDTPVETWGLTRDATSGKTTWETRPKVAGWYHFTSHVGQPGNAVIAGHVADRQGGKVFANVKDLKAGDDILVYATEATYRYRVVLNTVANPTDVQWVQPTIDPVLTLITCDGEWIAAERRYTQRRVILAQLVQP